MSNEEIISRFNSLPPEGQRQVIDFIARLQEHYTRDESAKRSEPQTFAEEEFIGMWRDRNDMTDSTEWVRATREHEWIERRG